MSAMSAATATATTTIVAAKTITIYCDDCDYCDCHQLLRVLNTSVKLN